MWLINHTSARKFEVAMLKALGIKEIFQPKNYPNDPSFRSASVDWSEDQNLTIPENELELLNKADWYNGANKEAWEIANKYFQVVFFILHKPGVLKFASKYFKGVVIWRTYGLDKSLTYTNVLRCLSNGKGHDWIKSLGPRFFFGEAYPHLADQEAGVLKNRRIYLPLGLSSTSIADKWSGGNKTILFVCPDIGFNPYYEAVYKKFTTDFDGLSYVIGGAQPIDVNDPHVLGFVPQETHERNMREMRLMFYHSTEPNHIHFHPFEAIRAGMPLVFMAGGILDRFGGIGLPGRCQTVREARKKIERILNDDWKLIEDIRSTQLQLLNSMKPANCEGAWQKGYERILGALEVAKTNKLIMQNKQVRVAVIVPVAYRGGSLRAAKLLARAIDIGAKRNNERVEVIFAHLDSAEGYSDDELSDLPETIKRRLYKWKYLKLDEARRAMAYAGLEKEIYDSKYQFPADGINDLLDCDFWIIVSDRIEFPILPLRPYVMMVYDYLQRYESFLPPSINKQFIEGAHQAQKVWVTTEFTRQDALQYAGLPQSKVSKLPMLAPQFISEGFMQSSAIGQEESDYFVWTTNLAPHKNHKNAIQALQIYYEQLNGKLKCHVTGVLTKRLFKSKEAHLEELSDIVSSSPHLGRNIKLLGELPEILYQRVLKESAFLWHAGRIDNGTFSVIEAAYWGVPALSSDYPAMREIDCQFALNLTWMDADSPLNMANQLKKMEASASLIKASLPSRAQLATESLEHHASTYWAALKECL